MCYFYSDKPKTDMESIEQNKNNNRDYNELKELIKKDNNNKNDIIEKFNLQTTFKLLTIENIILGFNSANEIYDKYQKEFKNKNLKKRDASHPSIYFDFGKGCGYYVDYLPVKGESQNAIFLYKNAFGVRYCEKTIEEFIKHNDTVIIFLKSKKELSFYEYFIKVCEGDSWTEKDHNYEKHNCNHFVLQSLKLLEVEFSKTNFEDNFLFIKENKNKKDAIKDEIPSNFHSILKIND